MLQTLIRRAAQEAAPYKPYLNPWKAKKQWPPDFTHLNQKHQFRLERRYRRRAKLKWARPKWNKFIKLTTWASIGFVGVYGVLFMDTSEDESVFNGIRAWVSDLGSDVFDNSPQRRDAVAELPEKAIQKERRSV